MKRHELIRYVFLFLLISLPAHLSFGEEQKDQLPEGFVYVDSVIAHIIIELRYYTEHNFVGERIDGPLR